MLNIFFSIFITSLILTSLSLLVLMLNTVHSLLLLLEIFILGSILLFFFKVEFLGLIFLMIYLGAILVLFLFVVMMLDIKTAAATNDDPNTYIFKGLGLWVFIPFFIWWVFGDTVMLSSVWQSFDLTGNYWTPALYTLDFYQLVSVSSNLQTIGWYLFDFQPFLFLLAGIILYIAMIGAIVISVDITMNADQKLQNAIVQGMRKGNVVAYFSTSVKRKHWEMATQVHWGRAVNHFPKPKTWMYRWLGKNTQS